MWNDTDVPLAIFFTFRTYGTWLHGDERGSVDRHNNLYGAPKIPSLDHLAAITAERMKSDPVILNASQRRATEIGLQTVCGKRGWHIYAANIRTNHAHAVIAIGAYDPDRALAGLKAFATREMRESGCWPLETSPWAEKGSCRRLWNEKHIYDASVYVNTAQGGDLPTFD